jgi:hypothetical protein
VGINIVTQNPTEGGSQVTLASVDPICVICKQTITYSAEDVIVQIGDQSWHGKCHDNITTEGKAVLAVTTSAHAGEECSFCLVLLKENEAVQAIGPDEDGAYDYYHFSCYAEKSGKLVPLPADAIGLYNGHVDETPCFCFLCHDDIDLLDLRIVGNRAMHGYCALAYVKWYNETKTASAWEERWSYLMQAAIELAPSTGAPAPTPEEILAKAEGYTAQDKRCAKCCVPLTFKSTDGTKWNKDYYYIHSIVHPGTSMPENLDYKLGDIFCTHCGAYELPTIYQATLQLSDKQPSPVKKAKSKYYEDEEDDEEDDDIDEDDEEDDEPSYYNKKLHGGHDKYIKDYTKYNYHVGPIIATYNDDNSTITNGVDSTDPTKVNWRQLSGYGLQNIEYLPYDRQVRIKAFIERLEWISATDIKWIRGGDAITCEHHPEWVVARFLRGGRTPTTLTAQYYWTNGNYNSMQVDVPPQIGHTCSLYKKCPICNKDVYARLHAEHITTCDKVRRTRCGYVPYKHRKWIPTEKIKSNPYACKTLTPAKIEREMGSITVRKVMCPKHENITPSIEYWLELWKDAAVKYSSLQTKKPRCKRCHLPVSKENGFTTGNMQKWVHAQCSAWDFDYHTSAYEDDKKCSACGKHPKQTIEIDQRVWCGDCLFEYFQSKPYYDKFAKHTKNQIKGDNSYHEDELDFASLMDGADKLLGPNPGNPVPDGWKPEKDVEAQTWIDQECGLCLLTIGSTKHVSNGTTLYHEDCASVLTMVG